MSASDLDNLDNWFGRERLPLPRLGSASVLVDRGVSRSR